MLLEGSHEGVLVGWGLETTVSELGAEGKRKENYNLQKRKLFEFAKNNKEQRSVQVETRNLQDWLTILSTKGKNISVKMFLK